ncbi:MAG: NDP-hexose 2,3-dehydratase family protein [Pseudomonadota bacterium]
MLTSPLGTAEAPIDDLSGVKGALEAGRRNFSVEAISAEEAAPHWEVIDGALVHASRGFFSATGVRNRATDDERLMLFQPQGAVSGVLSAAPTAHRPRCFVVQSRPEPGNVGETQMGCSIQSTPANYTRAHGGAAAPWFEQFLAFDATAIPIEETTQIDLGAHYFFKSKRAIHVEMPDPVPPKPGFYWLSREAMMDALAQPFTFNTDLRGLAGVCRWSDDPDSGELTPHAPAVRKSLTAPCRSDVLASVFDRLSSAPPSNAEFVPIEGLANWQITEDAICEREPRLGYAMRYFRCGAALREVNHWIQPLLACDAEGRAVIAVRERDGLLEFHLRIADRTGYIRGRALEPGFLASPGEPTAAPDWIERAAANRWGGTRESDEGGRFLTHVTDYQIGRCDAGHDDDPDDPTGVWLRLSELRRFLTQSNFCSIQLRVMASMLLVLR